VFFLDSEFKVNAAWGGGGDAELSGAVQCDGATTIMMMMII